jgi:hypothetical protein
VGWASGGRGKEKEEVIGEAGVGRARRAGLGRRVQSVTSS